MKLLLQLRANVTISEFQGVPPDLSDWNELLILKKVEVNFLTRILRLPHPPLPQEDARFHKSSFTSSPTPHIILRKWQQLVYFLWCVLDTFAPSEACSTRVCLCPFCPFPWRHSVFSEYATTCFIFWRMASKLHSGSWHQNNSESLQTSIHLAI